MGPAGEGTEPTERSSEQQRRETGHRRLAVDGTGVAAWLRVAVRGRQFWLDLRLLSPQKWERASAWERELDNQSRSRAPLSSGGKPAIQ